MMNERLSVEVRGLRERQTSVEVEGNDMPENRRTTRSLKRSRTLGEEASKSDKGSKKRRLQTQLTYKWL